MDHRLFDYVRFCHARHVLDFLKNPYKFINSSNDSIHNYLFIRTCRIQNPDIPRAGRGGAVHSGPAGWTGRGKTKRGRAGSPRKQPSLFSSRASRTNPNVSPKARTNEFLCKPMQEKTQLTTGLSAGPQELFVPSCWPMCRRLFRLHPVSITRFPLRRFVPYVHVVAKIVLGRGPKRRESSNGDLVYVNPFDARHVREYVQRPHGVRALVGSQKRITS